MSVEELLLICQGILVQDWIFWEIFWICSNSKLESVGPHFLLHTIWKHTSANTEVGVGKKSFYKAAPLSSAFFVKNSWWTCKKAQEFTHYYLEATVVTTKGLHENKTWAPPKLVHLWLTWVLFEESPIHVQFKVKNHHKSKAAGVLKLLINY